MVLEVKVINNLYIQYKTYIFNTHTGMCSVSKLNFRLSSTLWHGCKKTVEHQQAWNCHEVLILLEKCILSMMQMALVMQMQFTV